MAIVPMPLRQCPEPTPHWLCRDPLTGDELRLVPERGGLVTGWRCGGREILYLDSERFADPTRSVRGGIPVLFPICGNLPGNTLPLPQGPFVLPQHGFARDLPWSLTALEEPLQSLATDPSSTSPLPRTGVRLELVDTPYTREHFPFPFALVMEMVLEPSALSITARLSHRGEPGSSGSLPFSFGLHPYFVVSDPSMVRLEGLPASCLDHHTMEQAATADQMGRLGEGVDFLCGPCGPVRLVDPASGLALTLETRSPLDLVVVWTEPPRPMVCLEPWTGPRGALVSGERRLELDPGTTMELGCRYIVGSA
jgi:galactose mutarotase-like enzyme